MQIFQTGSVSITGKVGWNLYPDVENKYCAQISFWENEELKSFFTAPNVATAQQTFDFIFPKLRLYSKPKESDSIVRVLANGKKSKATKAKGPAAKKLKTSASMADFEDLEEMEIDDDEDSESEWIKLQMCGGEKYTFFNLATVCFWAFEDVICNFLRVDNGEARLDLLWWVVNCWGLPEDFGKWEDPTVLPFSNLVSCANFDSRPTFCTFYYPISAHTVSPLYIYLLFSFLYVCFVFFDVAKDITSVLLRVDTCAWLNWKIRHAPMRRFARRFVEVGRLAEGRSTKNTGILWHVQHTYWQWETTDLSNITERNYGGAICEQQENAETAV